MFIFKIEHKNVETKKEYIEKPKKVETHTIRIQEKKLTNPKQTSHEYHRENKKYQDKDIIYYQPKSKKSDNSQNLQVPEGSIDNSKSNTGNNSETAANNDKRPERIEQTVKDEISPSKPLILEDKADKKMSKNDQDVNSFDSDDEDLLNEGFRNVSEAIIGKDDINNDVGAIGSRANEKAFLKNNPRYVEHEKSANTSEPTSEEETHFYGYFGGYKPPVFNNDQTKQSQTSDRMVNSQIYRNDDLLANTPGLGLFQTKREGSRYSQNLYFPFTHERETEAQPKKQPVITNSNPFFTGSEDESGVISESSVSSKQLYHKERDETYNQNKRFNFPAENKFPLFFPGLNNQNLGAQENYDQSSQSNPNPISDSGLNFFFGPGIRHRNPTNSNSGSSNLPPGLH